MMKPSLRCPDCGDIITEDDERCPGCGAELDAPAISEQQFFELAQKAYDRGNDLRAALDFCDLAIQEQPDRAESHNLRGLILDALGRPGEAILAYREAVRLDPFLEDARANLEDAESEGRTRPEGGVWEEDRSGLNWTKIILGGAGVMLLLSLCALVYFLYPIGMQYFGPKQALIFEPDDSSITSQVTQADLQDTAQILTERSAQLGYPRISFVVSENNEITAKVPSQVDVATLASRISPIGLVEFVDFGQTSMGIGKRIATDLDYKFLQQDEQTRYHTLMTNAEIQSVSVAVDSLGKPAVQFTLTENGSNLFFEYTSQNIGSYLGIVQDKVVISCPYVESAIPDGQGIIQGAFTEEEAEDLAAVLQTRPLPIPIRVKQVAEGE